MNGSVSLRVGPVVLSNLRDAAGNELLAVFRDDMLTLDWIPAQQYYTAKNGYNEPATETDKPVKVIQFRVPGQVIADRLDVIGVDPVSTLAYLDDFLRDRTDDFFMDHGGHPYDPEFRSGLDDDARAEFDQEREFRASLSASSWVEMLAATPEEPPGTVNRKPGSRWWLLREIDYWDDRYALRIVLLAFPDAEVVLDVSTVNGFEYLAESDLASLASRAAQTISGMAGMVNIQG